MRRFSHRHTSLLGVVMTLLAVSPAFAQTPPPPAGTTLEALVREGWEVAGYVAASDIRTLILLRHKANAWLVQCSVLIDVTRNPRQVITCYELR